MQQVLEEAIERLTRLVPTTTASGRTDAGVHALGQVVHFLHRLAALDRVVRQGARMRCLPRDVRVLTRREMPQSFHATLDAKSKRYRYVIDNGPIASPFQLRYSWHVPHAARCGRDGPRRPCLLGRHDFRSFETEWPNRISSVRTILDLRRRASGGFVTIEVEADGFLYNMVRSIAGTLVLSVRASGPSRGSPRCSPPRAASRRDRPRRRKVCSWSSRTTSESPVNCD